MSQTDTILRRLDGTMTAIASLRDHVIESTRSVRR